MNNGTSRVHRAVGLAANLLSCALVVSALYFARDVLIPVALATLLAFLLMPALTRLEARGCNRIMAIVLAVSLAGLVMAGVAAVVLVQLQALARGLPGYQETMRHKVSVIRDRLRASPLGKVEAALRGTGADGTDAARRPSAAADRSTRVITVERAGDEVGSSIRSLLAFGGAFAVLGTCALALILAVFMLLQREDLRNRLISVARLGSLAASTRALDDAGSRISRYLIRQFAINASYGVAVGTGLFVIGVPHAPMWGLFSGVLRYIPLLGPWVGAVLPVTITFVAFPSWGPTVKVVAMFAVMELIINNIVEPLVYRQGTGLSPVAQLVSAAFWASLWGPIGIILATPLTVCAVVLGRHVPALGFIDKLLGDRPALRPAHVLLQRLLARDPVEATALVNAERERQGADSVFDGVLVPALIRARREVADGEMTVEDERYVLEQMGTLVAAIAPPPVAPAARILGIPARVAAEELTLRMLAAQLGPHGVALETGSTHVLASEWIERVREVRPEAVVIAVLPRSLPQARFLCELLREHFPDLRIVVGLWGRTGDLDRMIRTLRRAGAHHITTTLLAARGHVLAMIRSAARAPRRDPAALHALVPVPEGSPS